MPNRRNRSSSPVSPGRAPRLPAAMPGTGAAGVTDPSLRVSQPMPDPSGRLQGRTGSGPGSSGGRGNSGGGNAGGNSGGAGNSGGGNSG